MKHKPDQSRSIRILVAIGILLSTILSVPAHAGSPTPIIHDFSPAGVQPFFVSPNFTRVTGIVGQYAAKCDYHDTSVDKCYTNSTTQGDTAGSVSFGGWFLTNGTAGGDYPISRASDDFAAANHEQWGLQEDTTTNRYFCEASGTGGNSASQLIGTSNMITFKAWRHIFCTYNVATRTMTGYLNGTSQGSTLMSGGVSALTPSSFGITLGSRQGSSQGSVPNGSMDETLVYNRVLSQTEIAAIFNGGTPPTDNQILHYTYEQSGLPTVSMTVNFCGDSTILIPGQCNAPGAPLPNITWSTSGALLSDSGVTGSTGTISTILLQDGVGFINLSGTSDLYAPPQALFFSSPSQTTGTLYMWQKAAYCQPHDQSVNVPAQAKLNYSITLAGTIPYYTFFRQNPVTGAITPVGATGRLTSTFGNLTYPLVPSQNATSVNASSNQTHNDTGSYMLVISDSSGKPIDICTFEIQTGGTNFLPIVLDDTVNATITQTVTQGIKASAIPVDYGALALSAIQDFGEFSWRKPIAEFYDFFGMDLNKLNGTPADLLFMLGQIPWLAWLILLSLTGSIFAQHHRHKQRSTPE